jgi:uracil-DNA glycosylase
VPGSLNTLPTPTLPKAPATCGAGLEQVQAQATSCTACALHKHRTHCVFSAGSPTTANVFFIGEAPGQQEDEQGQPFVGRSGKLLTDLLAQVGLNKDNDCYIANTVKCRPPQNRKPTEAERTACFAFLQAQLQQVQTPVVVLVGSTALSTLFPKHKKTPISQRRGQWLHHPDYPNRLFMAIFHPSYLLRNHSLVPGSPRALTVQDLSNVSKYVGLPR